jgi:hypothetical protein
VDLAEPVVEPEMDPEPAPKPVPVAKAQPEPVAKAQPEPATEPEAPAEQALAAALDSLGQAHHRPYSRA